MMKVPNALVLNYELRIVNDELVLYKGNIAQFFASYFRKIMEYSPIFEIRNS